MKLINLKSIFAIGFIVTMCTSSHTLKVVKTNFGDEISRSQNLVFTLNREVVSDSSRLRKWDTTAYLSIEPAIAGKFMWTGPAELTFSPSGLLPPATDFTVKLLPALGMSDGKSLPVSGNIIRFHTPYLQIKSINTYWAVNDQAPEQVEIRLLLEFNNPVNPTGLEKLMKIHFSKADLPFTVLSQSETESVEVSLHAAFLNADIGKSGEVVIEKGMAASGGNHPTTAALSHTFPIPEKDVLLITETSTSFDEGKGVIAIRTNQPLQNQNFNRYITIEPSVSYEASLLSNGVALTGDFLANGTYTVTIKQGLKSLMGPELTGDFVEAVTFAAPEPYISFTTKSALYLPMSGERNLGVKIIGIPEVKLSVFKIFENNLQHYMRMGKDWYYDYEEEEYYDYASYSFDENYGKPVLSKVIQTRSLPRSGNISLLSLDLDELRISEPFKGVFIIKVESSDKRRLQDAVMVSLSDLGITVKEGVDEVMVFLNSLKDSRPVSGVTLDFYSTNNQKIFATTTDSKGVGIFREISKQSPGFRVGMISAKLGNDFNFLLFSSSQVELSRFDVGGKSLVGAGYDTYLYTDRDLFRPGDTCNFNTLVRTEKWELVKDIPLRFKVIAPNGKDFRNFRKLLSSAGSCEGSFAIPAQSMTGTYYLEVYTSNNILLASRRFAVEEFIPDRIKVSAKTDKESYEPGQILALDIQADNLFGTPAAGRKYEVELRMSRKTFRPETFPNFNFSVERPDQADFITLVKSGTTDPEGHATQKIDIPASTDIGIVEAKIFTTVFDENNRPVNRVNKVEIVTQKVFLGIKKFETWQSTRKPVTISIIAVDRKGKVLPNVEADVVILNSRYETVIERSGNSYRYVTQRKETTEFSKKVMCSSSGASISFVPRKSGSYKIKVRIPESESYVSYDFNAYGYMDTDYASFEVDREGEVEITPDKPAYKPGDKARLLIKAPFDGMLLLTFEQDKVLDYKYVEISNKSASVDVDIRKDYLPNVFVTVTLMREPGSAEIPLTVAHGSCCLKVDEPAYKIPVTIVAAEKSKANCKFNIGIQTDPGSEVTVAVIDEGILQVTGFLSPDPYSWFFSKRALAVKSYDLYGRLYPELNKSKSSVAGGEGFDLARRMNPLTNKRVRLLSKWSGTLKADKSGKCTFSIDIPQFSGALRVMAVAYQNSRFGSAEKIVKVTDPIVVSSSLPRFLSPGDKAVMSVNVTNTTASACKSKVEVLVSGPVTVQGTKYFSAELKAGAEQSFDYSVAAIQGIGTARITAVVDALGQKFTEIIDIPVRPASGLSFISGSGMVKGGNSKTFKEATEFVPGGTTSSLTLSKSPASEYLGNLNNLLRYPYGCCEQVISASFPQIYHTDLAAVASKVALTPLEAGNENPGTNVQQGIYLVESRQVYNGGFSLWPEGGMANWWVTAYAAHFLLEAEKAGFEVNRKVLEGALKYLEIKVKDKEYATYNYVSGDGTIISKHYPCQEIFYSIFALSLSGKAPLPAMNYYKSQIQSLSSESRYLLAASYLLAGDRKSYTSVLPSGFGTDKAIRAEGGSFGSYLRDISVSLLALLEVDPGNPQVGELAVTIGKEIKSSKWLSTQENAMAMLALGKFYKSVSGSDLKADVFVDGKPVGNFDNKTTVLRSDFIGKQVTINTRGTGQLYYFYEFSGTPLQPLQGEADRSIRVRKYFYDRNGNTLDDFRQNDLVRIVIKVEATNGRTIRNVAVTDLLPACFEIENQRLQGIAAENVSKKESIPLYTDIRDDRITFFTDLTGEKTFSYTVRVVSKGTFRMGPVTADAMYDGTITSYSGSRLITIR